MHRATLLPNGKVLVTGGLSNGSAITSSELYDPTTNTWRPTASLVAPRYEHTATLLQSGKVLVAGGNGSSSILASAEFYDSTASSAVPSLSTAMLMLPAAVLALVGWRRLSHEAAA